LRVKYYNKQIRKISNGISSWSN